MAGPHVAALESQIVASGLSGALNDALRDKLSGRGRMRALFLTSTAVATLLLLAGCNDQQLEQAAKDFNKAAEACLLDVRNHLMKYEKSGHCTRLGKVSMRYVEAGGARSDTPARHALTVEEGRTMAWMARAISASGNPFIALW
jgi:hypothetical protein